MNILVIMLIHRPHLTYTFFTGTNKIYVTDKRQTIHTDYPL